MNKPGKLTKARADELTKELETSLKFAKPPPRKPVSHGHSGSRTRSRESVTVSGTPDRTKRTTDLASVAEKLKTYNEPQRHHESQKLACTIAHGFRVPDLTSIETDPIIVDIILRDFSHAEVLHLMGKSRLFRLAVDTFQRAKRFDQIWLTKNPEQRKDLELDNALEGLREDLRSTLFYGERIGDTFLAPLSQSRYIGAGLRDISLSGTWVSVNSVKAVLEPPSALEHVYANWCPNLRFDPLLQLLQKLDWNKSKLKALTLWGAGCTNRFPREESTSAAVQIIKLLNANGITTDMAICSCDRPMYWNEADIKCKNFQTCQVKRDHCRFHNGDRTGCCISCEEFQCDVCWANNHKPPAQQTRKGDICDSCISKRITVPPKTDKITDALIYRRRHGEESNFVLYERMRRREVYRKRMDPATL